MKNIGKSKKLHIYNTSLVADRLIAPTIYGLYGPELMIYYLHHATITIYEMLTGIQ